MGELERVKASLRLRHVGAPTVRSTNRPRDAALLVTSNLPDVDWGSSAPDAAAVASARLDARFGAEAAEWLARMGGGAAGAGAGGGAAAGFGASAPSAPPMPMDGYGSGGYAGGSGGAYGESSSGIGYSSGGGAAGVVPTVGAAYQSAYIPSSQSALDKHSLFGPRPGQRSGAGAAQQQAPRPRYPEFDRTPAASIDLLWQPGGSGGGGSSGGAPSAPPDLPGALAGLAVSPGRSGGGGGGGSLLDAPMAPRPSAGPSLGPQEVAVHGMDASLGRPGGTCGQHAAGPGPGAAAAAAPDGGVKPLERRVEMRDVHVSVALMNDFLHYASSNTRRWGAG
jgi:hypothetical protein